MGQGVLTYHLQLLTKGVTIDLSPDPMPNFYSEDLWRSPEHVHLSTGCAGMPRTRRRRAQEVPLLQDAAGSGAGGASWQGPASVESAASASIAW